MKVNYELCSMQTEATTWFISSRQDYFVLLDDVFNMPKQGQIRLHSMAKGRTLLVLARKEETMYIYHVGPTIIFTIKSKRRPRLAN